MTRLADELASDPGYASGQRRFPGPVSDGDALAVVAAIHDELDEATAWRAEAAREAGRPLACGPGCTGCCEELVMVFEPEALRIARWLELPENAAARAAFLDAYGSWKQRVGDAPARLAEAFGRGDEAAQLAAHIEQWRKRILCAFNQGGLCTVYPVRPLLCRNAHAVDTSAHCYGDDASGLKKIGVVSSELDEFLAASRATIRALHHARGGPRLRPSALCEAVYALLTGATCGEPPPRPAGSSPG